MSKKKFTQNISDILADDLATLESIEPGAVLRPDPQPPVAQAEDAPTPTPGPEPITPEAREPAPGPGPKAHSEPRPEPGQKPPTAPLQVSTPEPEPAAASGNPRPRRESAGGGRGPGSNRDDGDDGEEPVNDTVTRLEITPPAEGGIRERALPGDRSLSPPSPPRARRGWNHPVARWVTYVVVVIVLTAIFLVLLVDIFHLG